MTRVPLPTLGFDPAPGEIDEIRAVVRLLGDASGEVGHVHRAVRDAGTGSWVGQAATGFHDHLQKEFAPKLATVSAAFSEASRTVSRWSDDLEQFQEQAVVLERRAADAARSEQIEAQWLAQDARQAVDAATKEAREAERRLHQHAHDDARAEVGRLIRSAHELHDDVKSRARQIASMLHEAKDMAPSAPGFFSRMAHAVGQGLSDAWAWTKAHADTIKMIGDVLSAVSGVLGTIAIFTAPFEPIGAIFGAAALATGAAAMGMHVLAKAAGADVSWATIGMDAIGVIPGVGTAGRAAKAGVTVTRVEEAGRAANVMTKLGGEAEMVRTTGRTFKVFTKEFGGDAYKIVDKTAGGGGRQAMAFIQKNYQAGQLVGTKSLNKILPRLPLLPNVIEPMSMAWRLTDGGIKIVPKLYTVPVTLYNDTHHDGTPLRVTHPGEVFRTFLGGSSR